MSDVDVGVKESEKVHVLLLIPEALHSSEESTISENFLGFPSAKLGLHSVRLAFFPILVEFLPSFEPGHGGTPVEVLLVEVGRDLNPVVQLLLNCMVSIVENHFSGFKDGRLPVLVEFGLLELVEEVVLDLAEWPVISLPVLSIGLNLGFTISVRRAIVRVSCVFINFFVSDPPELSAMVELLIIWLILIFHRMSEKLVPELLFLLFRLVVFKSLVIEVSFPSLLLFAFMFLLVLLVFLVVRLLLMVLVTPFELDIPVKFPLIGLFLYEFHGVVLDGALRLSNCCEHSIVF